MILITLLAAITFTHWLLIILILVIAAFGWIYISMSKNALNRIKKSNEIQIANVGLDDTFIFDFKNYGSLYTEFGAGGATVSAGIMAVPTIDADAPNVSDSEPTTSAPHKVYLKPIEVLKELETVPTPFNLSNLDDKIEMLKIKERIIVQHYSKREVNALIQRLDNRKKYAEHRTFFDSFQNTTDEKINVLLQNHSHLELNTSDLFIPEFPDEAIKIMEAYREKCNLICGKKPVFYVIAPTSEFRKKLKDRDPILLVQSPFGFFWQILGAWDAEMLHLSEL